MNISPVRMVVACVITFYSAISPAAVVAPYVPDSATLHLYHLDESTVPVVDFAVSTKTNLTALGNGATLSNASFSAGFGTALSTIDGGQAATNTATGIDAYLAPRTLVNGTADDTALVYADPVSGAFTFEALIRINFDPTLNMGPATFVHNGVAGNGRNTPMHLISGENEAGTRAWQFRLDPIGFNPGAASAGVSTNIIRPALEFLRVLPAPTQSLIAFLPTNGPNAIVSNQWYHVAVTYNGGENTADNFKVYWTLVDSSLTQAAELFSSKMTNDLAVGAIDFSIGNNGRIPTSGNFIGLIDEVRMSKVARSANDMLFGNPEVTIREQPVSQTVVASLPVAFSVSAVGQAPLLFQWRHAGTNISGATNFSYSIAAVQSTDAGAYDVIISNSINAVTSSVVTLTLRTPINLTWIGSNGTNWDTSTINWDSDSNGSADASFSQGDIVRFDNLGNALNPINLTNVFLPSSLSVDSDNSYTLTSPSGGGIAGPSGITKTGAGTLTVDTDNSYGGSTLIQSGTLRVGNGFGRGNLGTGPITNNAELRIFRTGALNFNNHFAGSGTFVSDSNAVVTVSGTNTFSGPVTINNSGTLELIGLPARGNSTSFTLNAGPGGGTGSRLKLTGGITIDSDSTVSMLGSSAPPAADLRCTLAAGAGTNNFIGNMLLSGDGSILVLAEGPASNSLFQVLSPSINVPAYTGQLLLRGVGNGVFASQFTSGGKVSKTDSGIWTITSTGNSWLSSDVAGGILRVGAHNALPNTVALNITTAAAIFDLAGFNQQVANLTGPGIIGNSSVSANATLTLESVTNSLFSGTIVDSVAGGTAKVRVTIVGGPHTFSGTNLYTGDTVLLGGSLNLLSQGQIPNSAVFDVGPAAVLNASFRTDQTLTLRPAQTLKGNGGINVFGNIVNNGTIELKANKTGGVIANDSVTSDSSITFGGTLKLVLSGETLTTSDTLPLFTAASRSGNFANIIPSVPASGLAWDTSTLAADGILRIAVSTVNTTPGEIGTQISGNELTLSWPEDRVGWRLQAQTNGINIGISSNWFDVSGSTMTNRAVFPLNRTNGAVFFRMVYP